MIILCAYNIPYLTIFMYNEWMHRPEGQYWAILPIVIIPLSLLACYCGKRRWNESFFFGNTLNLMSTMFTVTALACLPYVEIAGERWVNYFNFFSSSDNVWSITLLYWVLIFALQYGVYYCTKYWK